MTDMKSLRVIIILSSFFLIYNCTQVVTSSSTQGVIKNFPNPISLNQNQVYDTGRYLWTNTQYLNFSLNNEEKKLHQSSVYHSLNNLPDNEVTKWHYTQNNSLGMVRVIHSYQISDGYCRIYQALIEVDNSTKHWTNKACKHANSSWIFLK
jgi:hypothetical protein